ncbi:MAG: fused MFS/spermidine synthase [Gemmatimonadales bacterium]|nr:fused MFS/spermidine synthase [Gemmatimonadales bacterium]
MTARFRSSLFSVLIFTAFFSSGASCLIAEVTWNRMLIVVVGNSMSAAAMIISVFMGGLGLGSYVGGKYFRNRKASLMPYVVLELFIGIYVLLSPSLFDALTGLFTSLSGNVNNPTALTMIRLLVSTVALLLPAFLMGATFPAIISGTAPDTADKRSARTGYLYSMNTIGAAIGCFAAGYHLLLEFGVQATLMVALGFYILAALCALAANRLREKDSVDEVAGSLTDDLAAGLGSNTFDPRITVDPSLKRFLFVATFAIGFVALGYQVLLTRLSILYLGNSVSVFPLVLTAFLLGSGFSAFAGTWLYGWLKSRTGSSDRLFGIAAMAASALIISTPYILLSDWVLSSGYFARFADSAMRNPLPILAILIAPTVLIGALLPVAIRMLQPEGRGEATQGAATLYSLNTAGGMLGAGLSNHFLVPMVGTQATLIILAGICIATGAVSLLSPGRNSGRWAIAVVGVAGVVAVLVFTLPPMMQLYAGKIAQSTGAESAEVLLIHEGRAATVTVIDQADPSLGTYRDMYLNGVEEASTRYWHTQLFKLLGILPVLLHESDDDKEAVVIAFGAGITAGSVLASDEVSSLDVVDLNPDIEGINDLFTDVNGDVFHMDRFHFHNDDGRNYMVTNPKKYDLIIGDSTHPRAYDSWILYTEEFYRSVKNRLAEDGIFAQWVPVLGSMRGQLFNIHMNTFRTVFPNTTIWYIYGSDQAFLMATPEPLSIDVERLQRKLDKLPEWFRAEEYQIDTAARVAGFFWMDSGALDLMIGTEDRINTDDIHFFDKQSAVFPLPPFQQMPQFQASVLPYLKGADKNLMTAVRKEQEVGGHLASYIFFKMKPGLYKAFCAMPENGNVQYWMGREFSGEIPTHHDFCTNLQVEEFRQLLATHPGNPMALNGLADALSTAGQWDEALSVASKAVVLEPDNGMIQDTYGWILHHQGDNEAALPMLQKSLLQYPEHPVVLYHIGAIHHALGHTEEARASLQQALVLSPDFPGADEARKLLQ